MQKQKQELTIGVLDIYGFEIFMVSAVQSNVLPFTDEVACPVAT